MSGDPVVVIGAGPAGLAQALYLAQVRGKRVLLVEQAPEIGGNWASARTPWGLVDRGVLVPHEIGVPVFDDLFFGVLPGDEWHRLEGARRDISGNFFRGRLDTGSLFPDLRQLDSEDYRRCREEIIARKHEPRPSIAEAANLHDFLQARFGPATTDLVYRPIAQKFWRLPPEKMSAWAAKVVHVARAVIDGPEASLALKKDPLLDAVVGYPDQLGIPAYMQSGYKAQYPKKFGLTTIVDAMRAALERQRVEIVCSTRIEALQTSGGRITGVELTTPNGGRHQTTSTVVWTSPLPILGKLLKLVMPEPTDPPIPHRIVHLFLDRAPASGDLYWLWSYDGSNSITRFSNYSAYCPGAAAGGLFPVCVETHVESIGAGDASVIAQVEKELRQMDLIQPATRIVGGAVVAGTRVFPVSSVANVAALRGQRDAVERVGLGNLVLSNQDISAGRFYLADILAASVPLLEAL